MSLTRIEAAKTQTFLWLKADGMDAEQANRHHEQCAWDVLKAADEADHAAGIVRVRVDDETVERVARKLASFREAERAFDVIHPSESYARAVRFKYIDDARAVLAALTGAQS